MRTSLWAVPLLGALLLPSPADAQLILFSNVETPSPYSQSFGAPSLFAPPPMLAPPQFYGPASYSFSSSYYAGPAGWSPAFYSQAGPPVDPAAFLAAMAILESEEGSGGSSSAEETSVSGSRASAKPAGGGSSGADGDEDRIDRLERKLQNVESRFWQNLIPVIPDLVNLIINRGKGGTTTTSSGLRRLEGKIDLILQKLDIDPGTAGSGGSGNQLLDLVNQIIVAITGSSGGGGGGATNISSFARQNNVQSDEVRAALTALNRLKAHLQSRPSAIVTSDVISTDAGDGAEAALDRLQESVAAAERAIAEAEKDRVRADAELKIRDIRDWEASELRKLDGEPEDSGDLKERFDRLNQQLDNLGARPGTAPVSAGESGVN